ncbi:YqgE/AlgH family protein [Wenxinia marina]|uniref:UPF0301 protein Wenmar_00269 n=1 Tax=Wenxinia marina DSM 24838 TaxID=1123501 RepID=A0A0D0NRN3_9RHOB|nr:YqgE/AlgH family protein [Wenxinia marina]KIQ70895.1 Putative transcriptional regulator [Wenxinia marina DSM 24838]
MDIPEADLAGQLLIAMPGTGDSRFAHSVVYLCAHSDDGALGLIVNKPTPEIRFRDLLDQIGIEVPGMLRDIRVHFGGPVEQARGFVLHSPDYSAGDATLEVTGEISLTASLEVLQAIARGEGPANSMMALGYAGWGPGQLESEIARNGWLTAPARSDIVFGRANEHKWTAALKTLGIDPLTLSPDAGHA